MPGTSCCPSADRRSSHVSVRRFPLRPDFGAIMRHHFNHLRRIRRPGLGLHAHRPESGRQPTDKPDVANQDVPPDVYTPQPAAALVGFGRTTVPAGRVLERSCGLPHGPAAHPHRMKLLSLPPLASFGAWREISAFLRHTCLTFRAARRGISVQNDQDPSRCSG